jgi:hypothetical protein
MNASFQGHAVLTVSQIARVKMSDSVKRFTVRIVHIFASVNVTERATFGELCGIVDCLFRAGRISYHFEPSGKL